MAVPDFRGVRERDRKLDVAKGVLISLVVLGHYLETSGGRSPDDLYSGWYVEPQRWVLLAIYLVHMPAFVLLAGVTASTRNLGSRLVQIGTLLAGLQVVYVAASHVIGTPAPITAPFFALWFLLGLLFWLATMPLTVRWPLGVLVLSVIVSLASGFVPVGPLSRVLYFWPFFVAGHLFGAQMLRRSRALGAWSWLVGLAALAAGWIASGTQPGWLRGNLGYDALGVGTVEGVVGRAATLALAGCAIWLLLLTVPARQAALEALGQRSLSIYALHIAGVLVLESFFEQFHDDMGNGASVAIAVAAAVAALLVIGGSDRPDTALRAAASAPLRVSFVRRAAALVG